MSVYPAKRKWGARLCSGNVDVKDESGSSHPITEKLDVILVNTADIGIDLGKLF